MSLNTSVTAKLPEEVYVAQAAVIDGVKAKCAAAHYLSQLMGDPECTFVEVLKNQVAVQKRAQELSYLGTGAMVHFTETWVKLLLKEDSLDEALKRNKKRIFLASDRMSVPAAAHEFVHWLSHPFWGKTFDPNSNINEGATEALTRFLSADKFCNSIYDKEVKKVMEECEVYFKMEHLCSAYFNGDLNTLQKIILAFADKDANKRLAELKKQLAV